MRKFILLALLGLLAAACGSATAGNPSPSPSGGTGLGFDVTATERDHALTMRVGQKLELALNGGTTVVWQQVESKNQVVLTPIVHPGATAVRGVTLAAFEAKAPGSAEVTAVGTANCSSGQACPMWAMLYSLKVTVTQ